MHHLLVTRLQDMLYYNVLQEAYPNTFACISKPQGSLPFTDITELMPKIMPYHRAFIIVRHLYTRGGVRFRTAGPEGSPERTDDPERTAGSLGELNCISLLDTYDNIVTGSCHSKYVIYDSYCVDNYGTMLLSYFICNKYPVLLVKGVLQPELELFYGTFTQLVEYDGIDKMVEMWDTMRASELNIIADSHRDLFIEATASMPLMSKNAR